MSFPKKQLPTGPATSKLVQQATTMPVGALDSNKPITTSRGWWSRWRVEHGKIAAPEPAKTNLDGLRVKYSLSGFAKHYDFSVLFSVLFLICFCWLVGYIIM